MTTLLTGGGAGGREALDDDVDLARDRELVTRAQAGDRSAFDDLYMRYYRRLYRFCLRRLHDSHEAEDVAQEAFARAWRALPTFGGDRRFYPWLSVIASHLCTDVLRRRNRSTPVAEFHQGNVASTEDGGEELMLAAVDSEMVARAFTRLSDRHQRILNLREGSGWSYQRIADHEGVGITAVETLLWRARQALKREFASIAGADGRMAAALGSVFSMATLRRLLAAPRHAMRRMATTGAKGAAVAAGSAVAASAVILGAALGTPSTGASDAPPSFGGQSAPSVSQLVPDATGAPGTSTGTGAAGSGTSSASGGGSGLSLPASVPTNSVPGTSQLGSAVNSLGQTVTGTVNGVTGTVDGVVNGMMSSTSLLTDPITSLLGTATGTGGTSSGSTSTSTSTATPLATTTDTVIGTVCTTTGGVLGTC